MRTTLTQMRHYRRQYVAVSVAILIGVAFVLVSMQTSAVLNQTTRQSFSTEYRGADLIVTSTDGYIANAAADVAARVDGVDTADARHLAIGNAYTAGRTSYVALATLAEGAGPRNALEIEEGRLPEGGSEVLLARDVANAIGVGIGDTFEADIYGDDESPSSSSLTLVGIMPAPGGFASGSAPDGYVTAATMTDIAPDAPVRSLLVTLEDGADIRGVQADMLAALPDLIVQTITQYEASSVGQATDGVDFFGMMLLAFAIVALFVAGVVISNTFTILIAQRTRTVALMRCIGATGGQIRRSVLIEAAIIGFIASLLGVLTGAAIALGGVHILDATIGNGQVATDVPIGPAAIAWPIILGVLVTLGAALLPSIAATRVAPLAALRPTTPVDAQPTVYVARMLIAAAAIGGGGFLLTGGMVLGSQSPGVIPLLVGITGGMVSFCGVLLGAIVIVPGVARALGTLLSRVGGAPATVATSNAVRNPGRATATSMALTIAVTLITMMAVGAESSKATLARELDVRNPVDLRVAAVDFSSSPMRDEPHLPQSVIQAVQSDPDVIATTTAQKGFVLIDDVGYTVLAIDPAEAAEVTRIPAPIDGLSDGIALVPQWIADSAGLAGGETVDLTMEETGGTATFTVVIAESREWDNDILITRADANRVFPGMPTLEIWARFGSGTDQLDAVNRVQDNIGGGDRFYVSGGALDKATNERVLDTILAVVTGLLGIAVVIALVGVGNTLSLSVIERTRESAMLRAIGLTIPQFRVMLAMEGVMLSVVGALLGILLGIAYGFAGAFTVFAGTWGLVFRLPMERIALIVVIAIVAGLVASLLPARSATRTSLVASLAE